MLVLQIAVGIVLAVVILMFWDVILGLGLIFVVGAIALVAAVVAGIYMYENPPLAGIVLLVGLIGYAIHWDQKRRTYKRPEPLEAADGQGANVVPKYPDVKISWQSLDPVAKAAVAIWLLAISALLVALFVKEVVGS